MDVNKYSKGHVGLMIAFIACMICAILCSVLYFVLLIKWLVLANIVLLLVCFFLLILDLI